MIDRLRAKLAESPRGRRVAHWLAFPRDDYRPRWWLRKLVNPWVHERSGIIRRSARLDLIPTRGFSLGSRGLIEDRALVNNIVGDVHIGAGTLVGVGTTLIGPLEVGRDVLFAQYVVVSGLNHAYEDITQPISAQGVTTSPITAEDGVWVGAHAVITAGVHVGRNAVIAAGSVVTRDVPDYSVVAGSPARVIRRFSLDTGRYERERQGRRVGSRIGEPSSRGA